MRWKNWCQLVCRRTCCFRLNIRPGSCILCRPGLPLELLHPLQLHLSWMPEMKSPRDINWPTSTRPAPTLGQPLYACQLAAPGLDISIGTASANTNSVSTLCRFASFSLGIAPGQAIWFMRRLLCICHSQWESAAWTRTRTRTWPRLWTWPKTVEVKQTMTEIRHSQLAPDPDQDEHTSALGWGGAALASL